MDGQTHAGQSDPYVPLCFAGDTIRKCDYQTDRQTDGQTDAGQSDPYVPLCFAGDTIRKCVYRTDTGQSDPYVRLCFAGDTIIHFVFLPWCWSRTGDSIRRCQTIHVCHFPLFQGLHSLGEGCHLGNVGLTPRYSGLRGGVLQQGAGHYRYITLPARRSECIRWRL